MYVGDPERVVGNFDKAAKVVKVLDGISDTSPKVSYAFSICNDKQKP